MQLAQRRRLKRRACEGALELVALLTISAGCFVVLLLLGIAVAAITGIIQ
jgi:hypothetical protein